MHADPMSRWLDLSLVALALRASRRRPFGATTIVVVFLGSHFGLRKIHRRSLKLASGVI